MRKEDFYDVSSLGKRQIEVGDRVRFLNSSGGGQVTAFHGKDMVLVEDENGFDVPVLINECVVIGKEDDRKIERKVSIPPENEDVTKIVKAPEKPFIETSEGERLNISLAFLPVEPDNFIHSSFESYIINESNYYVYFNYMSCSNNNWTSRMHDLLEPDTKLFIEEFNKQDINELEHLCVQMIAFKDGRSYSFKKSLSVEFRLDTVKFYKLHCFTVNKFFNEEALIVPLVINDLPERRMLHSL
ncbi:MAG: DUF2027 domain-containing protein [Tannerella sp.]|jgi:hypothetical protein|nr:DUF2027 domain-containing protein [Tannerella sp.]